MYIEFGFTFTVIYIYIYIHTHIYTHTYIYIFIYLGKDVQRLQAIKETEIITVIVKDQEP